MNFRYAEKVDAGLLADVSAETFWDAYNTESILDQDFIKAYIAKTFSEEVIAEELADEEIIYIIPEIESEVCGFLRLLPNSTRENVSGRKPFQISRIYLRKKFWGKKLGSELMERSIEEAIKHNSDVIWLSVWQHNKRAINFYKKFDFRKVGEHLFDLAGSMQTDDLMLKEL